MRPPPELTRVRTFLLIPALMLALLMAGACTDDDGNLEVPDVNVDGTQTLDPSALLDNVDEVRTMLEDSASQFAPDVISDTNFEDNTLTVTMSDETGGLDDAESLCQDLASAISLGSISIRVVDTAGAELASCGMDG